MSELIVAATVIAVMIANIPAVLEQRRTDRSGFNKTMRLAGAYVLYALIGIGLVFGVMAPEGSKGPKVLFSLIFVLSWIVYGLLTLLRVVPRYREPPRWLMHFGPLDVVVLLVLFGSLAAYLWVA